MNTKLDNILWVTNAQYIGGYTLLLTFNNNAVKSVDLEKRLYGEVFEPLKEIENFKQFKLSDWTVEWNNGADFAPEYLYEIGKEITA